MKPLYPKHGRSFGSADRYSFIASIQGVDLYHIHEGFGNPHYAGVTCNCTEENHNLVWVLWNGRTDYAFINGEPMHPDIVAFCLAHMNLIS